MNFENHLSKLKKNISSQRRISLELESLSKNFEMSMPQEKEAISLQIKSLKETLKKTNNEIPLIIENIKLIQKLPKANLNVPSKESDLVIPHQNPKPKPETKKSITLKDKPVFRRFNSMKLNLSGLEKETIKRIKKKKIKIIKSKIRKPNVYVKFANKLFFKSSVNLSTRPFFKQLKKDIIQSKLQFILTSYIATIIFTTIFSIAVGIGVFAFFLFFNFGVIFPFVTRTTEELSVRFLKVFWIVVTVPVMAFIFMYFYPSMERKSLSNKINQELPFATIHMFAISGSMIDPSKIFSIIIKTKEYPSLEKELTRLMNEINIYGYDIVSALRSTAFNSSSRKLSDLFNGMATTITSGGDLRDFFDKRSQSLLFEHRLEREKYTKSAETFMDIYISVVIAAPMILMLLLIMIKISGLGFSLSTTAISLIMILGVGMINILFLTFLQLKQPEG